MNLRPAVANWFELLVVRDDLATAMERLARARVLPSLRESSRPSAPPDC